MFVVVHMWFTLLGGGNNRGTSNGGLLPSQVIINGDGLIQRNPKEVAQGGSQAGFANLDPDTLQAIEEAHRIFKAGARKEISGNGAPSVGNQDGSYGLQQPGTHKFKGN